MRLSSALLLAALLAAAAPAIAADKAVTPETPAARAAKVEAQRRAAIRCPIDAARLVGRWERIDGNGLDAIELSDANAFASHGDGEHERSGMWRLFDCTVHLDSDEGHAGLQIQAFEGDTLRVEDLDEHENAVLRRRDPAR